MGAAVPLPTLTATLPRHSCARSSTKAATTAMLKSIEPEIEQIANDLVGRCPFVATSIVDRLTTPCR
jgi:hypothetical protein